MYIGLLQRRQGEHCTEHIFIYTYIYTLYVYRSIAEEAGADKDIVQRTHSLALENARRREELQVERVCVRECRWAMCC